MNALIAFTILLCIFYADAFLQRAFLPRTRFASPKMMFGGSKPQLKNKIIIKVDGKEIECAEPVNLRKQLMASKVDVYPLRGKLSNCGGAGICGTCAVRVLEGAQNLNPPSKNEQNTLRGKAADLRLSCCAKVSGPIKIVTKP